MKYLNLNYISYLSLFIGFTVFIIGIVQKFSTLDILASPTKDAALFISLGFILIVIARSKRE